MSESSKTTEWLPTPGQTIGPFFAFGLNYDGMEHVVHPYSPGSISLSGVITDGAGEPIPDALIEVFGADADGSIPQARGSLKRDSITFTGFGRAATNDDGRFVLWTREPGALGDAAPFIAAAIFARGLTDVLHTRIYMPGHTSLETDPLLSRLSAEERDTLVATRLEDGHLVHDIRLQGENETVFLGY